MATPSGFSAVQFPESQGSEIAGARRYNHSVRPLSAGNLASAIATQPRAIRGGGEGDGDGAPSPIDCLDNFGSVYIIQPYREQEKCAPASWAAQSEECQCSVMGVNHGASSAGGDWKVISDAFANRRGKRHLACKLPTGRT